MRARGRESSRGNANVGRYSRHDKVSLTKIAWDEFKITRQFSSQAAWDDNIACWRIPGWFWAHELGNAHGAGPSLTYILADLDDINRKNRAYLANIARLPHRAKQKRKPVSSLRQRNQLRRTLLVQALMQTWSGEDEKKAA